MASIKDIISQFREKDRIRSKEFLEERARLRSETEIKRNYFNREILPNLRNARSVDYSKWLIGYIESGGKPTHSYNYDLPSDFYIAIRNFSIVPLYGGNSLYK